MKGEETRYSMLRSAAHNILTAIGEDVDRDGLKGTPDRVARAYLEMFSGYKENPDDYLKVFEEPASDTMILVKDVKLVSFCEHHLMPFTGFAHFAYIPNFVESGDSVSFANLVKTEASLSDVAIQSKMPSPNLNRRLLGLSKVPRIIRVFSARLQIQERLTHQIAHYFNNALTPLGVGLAIEAEHTCMSLRGVKEHQSKMTTSCLLGVFRHNSATRDEFFRLIGW